jgi:hypothetical protein
MWASPEFYLTWKHKATRCGCSVWELAPSAPRTDGCDTGLFAESSWPTPASRDVKGQTQNAERMDYVPNILKANWPTPAARDTRSESCTQEYQDKRDSEARGKPLTWVAKSALATPNVGSDGGPQHPTDAREQGHALRLKGQIRYGQTTSGCLARTEKFAERLILLSSWLMGVPWTSLRHWPKKAGRTAQS